MKYKYIVREYEPDKFYAEFKECGFFGWILGWYSCYVYRFDGRTPVTYRSEAEAWYDISRSKKESEKLNNFKKRIIYEND